MADATVKLKVLLEAAGIKPTTEQLKKLKTQLDATGGATKTVANAQNKLKRNLDGTAERTGNATKDFARQAQGLGGLVAAYATIAANVFALSSAFLVLRRAADLRSMIISAENFSNRFGVSVVSITKRIQEATGGALDFAEALPSINKAISAGFSEEKIRKLAVAATKASQTFGGSATEGLNRFISAAQRGRVEIVNTLGIVIKTEDAYKDFAATIGKTALQLTAYDRQLAITNALIAESENVFGSVVIDPNPFQQLLTTITDLKDTILGTVTDALTPLFNSFNKSKAAALALIAVIIKSVSGRIFPAIQDQITAATKKGLDSNIAAGKAAVAASKAKDEALLKSTRIFNAKNRKFLVNRIHDFEASLGTLKKAHASFTVDIVDQERLLNAKVFQQRKAALAKQIQLLEAGATKGLLTGLPSKQKDLPVLRDQLRVMNAYGIATGEVAVSQKHLNLVNQHTVTGLKRLQLEYRVLTSTMKAVTVGVSSAIKTGFAGSFIAAEGRIIDSLKFLIASYKRFAHSIVAENSTIGISMIRLGRVIGASAGFITGTLTAAFSVISSLTLVVSLGALAWEKYGDKIQGISPGQRKIIDANKDLSESLLEVNKRIAENISKFSSEGPQSLKKFKEGLDFLAGSIDSINEALNTFNTELASALGNRSVRTAITDLEALERKREKLINKRQQRVKSRLEDPENQPKLSLDDLRKESLEINKISSEIVNLNGIINETVKNDLPLLLQSFVLFSESAKRAGYDVAGLTGVLASQIEIRKQLNDIIKLNYGEFDTLVELIAKGDRTGLSAELERIEKNITDPRKVLLFRQAISSLIAAGGGALSEASRVTTSAISQLEEANGKISTFVQGLDIARAQAGEGKEYKSFILNINRELTELIESQGKLKNFDLAEQFNAKELERVRILLGFSKDEIVQLGPALDRSRVAQEKILASTIDSIVAAKNLKTIQSQIATVKAEQIKSDDQALDNLREIERLEQLAIKGKINSLIIDRNSAQLQLNALKDQEDFSELSRLTQQNNIDAINAQITAERQLLQEKEKSIKYDLQALQFQQENVKAIQGALRNLKQANDLQIQNTLAIGNLTELRQQGLDAQKADITLSQVSLDLEIRKLEVEGTLGAAQQRKLIDYKSQLALLQMQTEELKRQQLVIDARREQEFGKGIFDRADIELMGKFFVNSVADELRKLEPIMKVLGEGFATTMFGTVDAAVDKLFEGHGFNDFAAATLEALKTGLRDTFSEAIKNAIKSNLGVFFDPKETAAEARHRELVTEIEALTVALRDNTMSRGSTGTATGVMGIPISPIIDRLGGKKDKTGEETVSELGSIEAIIASQTGVLQEVADTTKEGSQGFISTLLTVGSGIISAIFGQGASDAVGGVLGNIGSFFGFANGGIIPHAKMAAGGVINKPTMALVGEGKNNEAVVPLPNNREIPVQLMGSGGGDEININQSFDFRGADPSTEAKLRQHAKLIGDQTFNRVFTEINKGGRYAKMVGRR